MASKPPVLEALRWQTTIRGGLFVVFAFISRQKRPESCFLAPVNVSQIITLSVLVLTGLCALSCSKQSPVAPPVETNAPPMVTNAPVPEVPAAPVPSRTTDLGVLQLTNRCETRIQLAGGKSCAITPVLIDRKNVQLTMVLESKTTDGKIQGLNITKVVAKTDQQFEVDFGGLNLTLTPQMAQE